MTDIAAYARDHANLKKLAEGKTKEIFSVVGHDDLVLIRSKDQLTAFNAARKSDVAGKGRIANITTSNVFKYLQEIGLRTHFVSAVSDCEFLAHSCQMIPIEWVARRVATGSFLKRNPGVPQGFRFPEPKLETFYKDDANDDPQWSDEQICCAAFSFNGVTIGRAEIALMKKMTSLIFLVLEKAWQRSDCSLIDMKVEFGVTPQGEIVLSDVIDNDSWRVWPSGDKRLQLDKQMFREMPEVTTEAIAQLVANYEKVMNLTGTFVASSECRVLIIMGSQADAKHCETIAKGAKELGLRPVIRVSSAHKATRDTLDIVSEFEDGVPTVVVAVAGRSNGLGPVIAGNSTLPVINCPPVAADWASQDIWSSLRMPSGLGCTTVLGADEAAMAAAKMLASHSHLVYGKILTAQLDNYTKIYKSDLEFVSRK